MKKIPSGICRQSSLRVPNIAEKREKTARNFYYIDSAWSDAER